MNRAFVWRRGTRSREMPYPSVLGESRSVWPRVMPRLTVRSGSAYEQPRVRSAAVLLPGNRTPTALGLARRPRRGRTRTRRFSPSPPHCTIPATLHRLRQHQRPELLLNEADHHA